MINRFRIITVWYACVLLLAGCVKEISIEEPIPEKNTIPFEKPTQTEESSKPNPRIQASLKLTDQGRRLLEENKPDNAIRVLEQAISLNPGNGRNYYYLSEAWLIKGFVPEAREFNRLAESQLIDDRDWARRVDRQADRITELENKIKKHR